MGGETAGELGKLLGESFCVTSSCGDGRLLSRRDVCEVCLFVCNLIILGVTMEQTGNLDFK